MERAPDEAVLGFESGVLDRVVSDDIQIRPVRVLPNRPTTMVHKVTIGQRGRKLKEREERSRKRSLQGQAGGIEEEVEGGEKRGSEKRRREEETLEEW